MKYFDPSVYDELGLAMAELQNRHPTLVNGSVENQYEWHEAIYRLGKNLAASFVAASEAMSKLASATRLHIACLEDEDIVLDMYKVGTCYEHHNTTHYLRIGRWIIIADRNERSVNLFRIGDISMFRVNGISVVISLHRPRRPSLGGGVSGTYLTIGSISAAVIYSYATEVVEAVDYFLT